MSLQIAAQHLASKGRGPDTMLVHMAPGEVKSLQELAMAHGGTLTTNPDTGLPEAGFLSSILPMIAGAALGPAGFGLTAMQAGLAAGALGTVMTGSLRKGLMAGLGAYGGAGIGDVIGKAGTAAIEAGATGAAGAAPGTLTGADFAGQAASLSGDAAAMLQPPVAAPGAVPMSMGLPQGTPLAPMAPAGLTPQGIEAYVTKPPLPVDNTVMGYDTGAFKSATAPVTPQPAMDTSRNQMDIMSDIRAPKEAALREAGPMGRFTKGLGAIADKPSLLFNKDNLGYGAAALGSLMLQEPENAQAPKDTEQYRYAYNPNREMPPYRAGDVGEFQYFRPSYTRLAADGGIMNAMPVQRMSDANNAEMLALNRSQMYAKGGISHLGDYSDGGRLLKGPGDGVSDSIPATIANKRPARLADGEFVVPARIVSELGNGSTEAGARKLYAMMNRVQQRRAKTVGKGKVAVNSRAEKLLPA